MIFKSPGGTLRAMVVTQKTRNFWQEISNAILPFPWNFHHNVLGAKYFEAKRVQTV